MNEPPGARSSVALSGLTVAESFRDADHEDGAPKDILFFIINLSILCSSTNDYGIFWYKFEIETRFCMGNPAALYD